MRCDIKSLALVSVFLGNTKFENKNFFLFMKKMIIIQFHMMEKMLNSQNQGKKIAFAIIMTL